MLHNGDCVEVLKELPSDSVDALVTDPPAGIAFMGKEWDTDKGGRKEWCAWLESVMRECIRVMKPGAHGLVWALPRTAHWTATALEDAGFEIRDCITHLFGSGFPKSYNVSKAIDAHLLTGKSGPEALKEANSHRPTVALERRPILPNGRGHGRNCDGSVIEKGMLSASESHEIRITAPATDAAKQWQGFGTALKPAAEFWWLVRKPCSEKTVAANVLKWGTGGLNIDGCRIESDGSHHKKFIKKPQDSRRLTYDGSRPNNDFQPTNSPGRFPANLVFSHSPHCTEDACDMFECAVKMLDVQAGQAASRYFYCAKVSPSERGESTHPTMKTQKLMRYLCRLVTPPGGTVLDPFMGSGSTGLAAKSEGFGFIGIEREPEYFEIAQARIGAVL